MIRVRVCVEEGTRNASEGGARSAAWLLLLLAALVLPAVSDGQALQALRHAELAQWQAGASTLLLESESGIDGPSCDRLQRQPPVMAAGGVQRTDRTITLRSRPGSPLAVVEATWGAVRVSGLTGGTTETAAPVTDHVLVSPETMASLGLREKDRHVTATPSGQRLTLHASADLSLAGSANTGVVTVVPVDRVFDACLVQARPAGLSDARQIALATLLAGRAGERVESVTVTAPDRRDLLGEHRGRPTRWAWLATGTAVAAVWMLIEAARRPERGLYLAVGLRRSDLGVVRMSELFIHVATALAAGIPVALAWQHAMGVDADIALESLTGMLGTTAAVAIGGLVAVVATPKTDVLAMIKDRG